MDKVIFQLEVAYGWLLVVILVAAGLSEFQYTIKNVPWNKQQNIFLASIRFLAIAMVLLLFLSPSMNRITNDVMKPQLVIAMDNSASVVARGTHEALVDSSVSYLEGELVKMGVDFKKVYLDDTSVFSGQTTDLSSLVHKSTRASSEEQLRGIILLSDGIYNVGSSPAYKSYMQPIFTLGLGDTIPPKDISISRIRYNDVTYKDNQTPIQLEITQKGYTGQQVIVSLIEKGRVITKKKLTLASLRQPVDLVVTSKETGLRRIQAVVTHLPNEVTTENNAADIFLEVIEGKQKILLVATAPHPDLKAIRTTLEQTGNYTVTLKVHGLKNEPPADSYDVVIYHGDFQTVAAHTPVGNPGKWYILSTESSLASVSGTLPYIQIYPKGSKPDKVTGAFNTAFSKFTLDATDTFDDLPPLQVPFADYELSGPVEVLLYQKLGSVTTEKPLMAFYDNGSEKSAVLLGQNIWRWKMQEYALKGDQAQFDEWLTKTVQYLSIKNDEKQFRFRAMKKNFTTHEPIRFESKIYNDIYEPVFGKNISLKLVRASPEDSQAYDFINSESSDLHEVPRQEEGVYRYQALVELGGKELLDQGEFAVKNVNLEYMNLTADHQLLRAIARKSGGSYQPLARVDALLEDIESRDIKPILKSEESVQYLLSTWWWYFIIFVLFSTEWFLRKYWGGY